MSTFNPNTLFKMNQIQADRLFSLLQAKLRKLERQVKASKRSLDTLTSAYELLHAGLEMREGQYKSMERTVNLSSG